MGESIAEVAADSGWFCDRGNFWGTIQQLVCCAKCGGHEVKRHDEPRHYAGIFTARFHTICDRCFDTLPDSEEATDHAR